MRTDRISASETEPVPRYADAAASGPVSRELAKSALIAALHDTYDTTLLAPATAAPVAHPNGFVKLPLVRAAKNSRRFFLHIWLAGDEDTQAHDHRWDFSSTVLCGTIYNTLLDIAEVDDSLLKTRTSHAAGYRVIHYEPHKSGYRFDASVRERVIVTGHQTAVVCAGNEYSMPAFAFHRARALPGTMTLVARGVPMSRHARVLVRGEVSEEPQQWRHVGASERRGYLRDALDCLG